MAFHSKPRVDIRIRALKFNLDRLNLAYEESRRDSFTDVGMEYNKQYPYNEAQKLIKKQEELKKSREDVLFFTILNFTQVFYSIKEYLRMEYPSKKDKIENFFSNKPVGFEFKARKDISNDLKHNPANDLKYGFGQIGKTETKIEGSTMFITTRSRETWFYYELDSVEHCNNLYNDVIQFMETEFGSNNNQIKKTETLF